MDWKAETLKKEIIPKLPNVSALHPTLRDIYYTALYQTVTISTEDHKRLIVCFTEIAHVFRDKFSSGARITAPLISHLTRYLTTYDVRNHKLSMLNTPYPLHAEKRFSHTYICARSSSGKTTLLENLIDPDIANVKRGLCSVVVLDSQGRNELLGRIEKWQVMDDVPYKIIDSTTPMNPLILPAHKPHEREMMENGAIEMLGYVFAGALGEGGALTSKMQTLFDYCLYLMFSFPSSVIDLVMLMQPKGLDAYRQFLPQQSPQVQLFFDTQFNSKGYIETKEQISNRLSGIMKNPAFVRMFTARQSFDFYTELQKPQILLVDANLALLKENVSGMMQRYIVAQLLSAAERRATTKHRLPTYVYIDEAAVAISEDENVARIIDRARKFKVGFTFAIQRESQIKSPNVLDALQHCEYRFTPAPQKYKWNLEVHGEPPIIISSPLVDRGTRAEPKETPKKEEQPKEPAIQGEIVEPYETTSVDSLRLTYDNEDITPR